MDDDHFEGWSSIGHTLVMSFRRSVLTAVIPEVQGTWSNATFREVVTETPADA